MIPQKIQIRIIYLLILNWVTFVNTLDAQELIDFGNRQEGTYTLPISTPPLELISFTGFFEDYQWHTNQQLQVQFFLEKETPIAIKARQTRGEILYRMYPKSFALAKGWNQFKPWPVDDVLSKLKMPAQDVGIMVNSQDRPNTVAPAFVFHSDLPDIVSKYHFTFLPGKNLTRVSYKIYQGDFYQKEPQAEALVFEKYLGRKSKYGGIPISLSVPVSDLVIPDNWAGWLTLVFKAREIGTNELILYTYYFYHQPILPKYETELIDHSRTGG